MMDHNLSKDPYARRYLREVKTTTTKFIANSGCILGFCMGFSLISGAEVVFHIVAGLFTKKRVVTDDAFRLKERRDRERRSDNSGKEGGSCVITSVVRFQVRQEIVVALVRLLHQ